MLAIREFRRSWRSQHFRPRSGGRNFYRTRAESLPIDKTRGVVDDRKIYELQSQHVGGKIVALHIDVT